MAKVKVATEAAGNVWKVVVPPGERVEADEPVMILESMKMEVPVNAPRGGTVLEILAPEGTAVGEDEVVAIIEAD